MSYSHAHHFSRDVARIVEENIAPAPRTMQLVGTIFSMSAEQVREMRRQRTERHQSRRLNRAVMTEAPTVEQAHHMGRDAHGDGTDFEHNPFGDDLEGHRDAWANGWLDACHEAMATC